MTRLALIALLFAACTVGDNEPLPVCADLGCPDAPSGSALSWEPCTGATCFCHIDHELIEECTP